MAVANDHPVTLHIIKLKQGFDKQAILVNSVTIMNNRSVVQVAVRPQT